MKTQLKLTNTLTRKKEVFEPINTPFVGLYVCGPTLYNPLHLGNLLTFVRFDVVYRYLKHLDYKVRYVRNITDVGHIANSIGESADRVEEQAKLEQRQPMEIVQKYTVLFHDLMNEFNCLPPDIEPTAAGHIIEQIEMVQEIIDNGYGYEVNGSVYFDLKKYMEKYSYGEISGRKVEELLTETRDLEDQGDKKNAQDFVIWKHAEEDKIMKWNSPWGPGVPGWHMECSVMSTKYLGKEFDIHGGGMDLKFPHHEAEIAQNVGACGCAPVKYWMHANMLTVNGDKMSKSKGNSIYPEELISGDNPLLDKGYSAMVIRFFMLQSHYSSELDISNEALQAAEKGFTRLMKAYQLAQKLDAKSKSATETDAEIKNLVEKCTAEMNDDFNTPRTIAVLFDLATVINKINDGALQISSSGRSVLQENLQNFIENILGLKAEENGNSGTLDGVMQLVLDIRKTAKENKDWTTSDKIRDELTKAGVKVKDGKDGASWEIA